MDYAISMIYAMRPPFMKWTPGVSNMIMGHQTRNHVSAKGGWWSFWHTRFYILTLSFRLSNQPRSGLVTKCFLFLFRFQNCPNTPVATSPTSLHKQSKIRKVKTMKNKDLILNQIHDIFKLFFGLN